jgi:hypothetical protein
MGLDERICFALERQNVGGCRWHRPGQIAASIWLSETKRVGSGVPFKSDSAIAFDAKSEERTFRSETNGLLPLSGR